MEGDGASKEKQAVEWPISVIFNYGKYYSINMSILQDTLGQFRCAMIGGHKVSDEDVERLYTSKEGQCDTECSRCGIRLNLSIDCDHRDIYSVTVPDE